MVLVLRSRPYFLPPFLQADVIARQLVKMVGTKGSASSIKKWRPEVG